MPPLTQCTPRRIKTSFLAAQVSDPEQAGTVRGKVARMFVRFALPPDALAAAGVSAAFSCGPADPRRPA